MELCILVYILASTLRLWLRRFQRLSSIKRRYKKKHTEAKAKIAMWNYHVMEFKVKIRS